MPKHDDYDVAMRALRRKNIHESKVLFRPIERSKDNTLIFRVRRFAGPMAQWREVPIWQAQQNKEALIGFIFPDGTLRSDAEILCSEFGGINLPIYVAFWKPHVPLNERNFVADGKQTRLQERPTILVR